MRRKSQPGKRRLSYLLVTLIIVYFSGCWVLSGRYISPRRSVPEKPSYVESVLINGSHGKVPLWSSPRLALKKDPKPVVFVCAHGYGGDRHHWLGLFSDLPSKGFEVVAPAMPAHDENPDSECGFGVKEAKTLLDTVTWVRSQYDQSPKIILVGVSMGGAACWLASAQDPTISAVVTEAAFADLETATTSYFDHALPLGRYVLLPVKWMAQWRSGINPANVRPVDCAAIWKGKPALVIHDEEDSLFDKSNAERLSKAAGCRLWVVAGAEHAQAMDMDQDGFVKALIEIAK